MVQMERGSEKKRGENPPKLGGLIRFAHLVPGSNLEYVMPSLSSLSQSQLASAPPALPLAV